MTDSVIIPAQIREMAQKISDSAKAQNERHASYLSYVAGWVEGAAEDEYRALLARDGIPDDPRVVSLLCELAVMRGLVRWHEIKDQPPPMPSISNL